LGREQGFLSQRHKILKLSYYRKYCSDSNQIEHNDTDHQVISAGGPNTHATYPRRRPSAIVKKTFKSPYLSNRLIDFDEIWRVGADCDKIVKISIFSKTNMAAAAILKNHINRDNTTMD